MLAVCARCEARRGGASELCFRACVRVCVCACVRGRRALGSCCVLRGACLGKQTRLGSCIGSCARVVRSLPRY